MFLKAARHGELDMMHGVSANIMCGQEGKFGTNSFQVYLDINEMQNVEESVQYEKMSEQEKIEKALSELPDNDRPEFLRQYLQKRKEERDTIA